MHSSILRHSLSLALPVRDYSIYDLAILQLSAASPAVSTQSFYPCPLLGADVFVPISLSTSIALKIAISGLKNSLDAAL